MKNNMLKSFICFCLILILCLAAASCSGNADYSVEKIDGRTCIVFDDISRYRPMEFPGCILYETGVYFNSVKELKDTITKGNLTEDQKRSIVRDFEKYEDNAVLTTDFNKLYDAVLPEDVSMGGVNWGGKFYSFALHTEGDIFGWMHYNPSGYKGIFESEYETFFDRDLVHVTETKTLEDGKIATFYYTGSGEFVRVRFSLNIGAKTIIVDKEYCLNLNFDGTAFGLPEPSASYPLEVKLFCDEGNDKCWYAYLYGFAKDPTDEWLSGFGLTPYTG